MKIPIKKYTMDESASWEERYRQLEAHHTEESSWMFSKLKEQEVELQRIQRLPTLEWARVTATIMQQLASVARFAQQNGKHLSVNLAETLDRGKTYVSRLEARVEDLTDALHQAKVDFLSLGTNPRYTWSESADVAVQAIDEALNKVASEAVSVGHEECPDNPCPGHFPYCEGVNKDTPPELESKVSHENK